MPRRCSVCEHPERVGIDAAFVEGGTLRDIARRFSLSKDAVARHGAEHVPASMRAAVVAHEVARGDALIDKVRALEVEAKALGKRAASAGDLKTALAAIRELTRIVELQARIAGDLSEAPVIQLGAAADWLDLRTAILAALDAFPEARIAVANAITGSGAATQ